MQAGSTTVATSTGSKTIADLIGRAADQYADRVAARHKVDGAWADVTHVVYFPASNVGVQVSTDRFIEVY